MTSTFLRCVFQVEKEDNMCFSGREQSDVAALRTVVQSVLADAAALHVKSLALPLIGAGKAQWPAALAAKTQVAAICALASQGRCGQLQVGSILAGSVA